MYVPQQIHTRKSKIVELQSNKYLRIIKFTVTYLLASEFNSCLPSHRKVVVVPLDKMGSSVRQVGAAGTRWEGRLG